MAPYLTIEENDLKIQFPCRVLLCGASGSGKSSFCRKLIKYSSHMFSVDPDRIIYYHSIDEAKLIELAESDKRIELIHASKFSPDSYLDKAEDENLLLVFDDMMQSSQIYGEISKLFTMYSRHKNIGCIFMTQNPYFRGNPDAVRYNRDILANANEVGLFRSPKDSLAAMTIGRQAFPGRFEYFKDSYIQATQNTYSYLYCSFNQRTKPDLILRSSIFFPIENVILYIERTKK